MIIKRITIENFLCYYGEKIFDLSDGLNIILGENGEGKTKFFEALEWLFNGNNNDLDLLVSAKALEETEIGSSFNIKVSIQVEANGVKNIITKSFLAKKEGKELCSTSNYMLVGIEENKSGEREQVDGKSLLDRIFPFQIRKYSMFKGEAELDIFKSDEALLNLINLFSDAKHYDKYSEKGSFLREKAEKAVEESSKADKKNEIQYKKLEGEIKLLEQEIIRLDDRIYEINDEIKKIEYNILAAESYVKNASDLEIINTRIKNIDSKITQQLGSIDENYTLQMFDQNWITVNFESIHNEYVKKISKISLERRKLQSDFDTHTGFIEGEKKAKEDLLKCSIPLPIGIPSKAHMEEMLNEQICKVCNRPAPKGSEAYDFMMKRLAAYLKSQVVSVKKVEAKQQLFKYNYISRLEYLSASQEDRLKDVRSMTTRIKDFLIYIDSRKEELSKLKEQLENEKLERSKILGNSSIAEEKLVDVLKNYNVWQEDIIKRNREYDDKYTRLKVVREELNEKLKEKDKIDLKSANSFYIKTRSIIRDIEAIFKETKEKKFDEFIDRLQIKSNNFFNRINVDSFTGMIEFKKSKRINKTIVDIKLRESGRVFYNPNQSLLTSMHISILFAISELAYETREEKYPMIFDAPISSFGENKSAKFLSLIYETHSQKILLLKDFLSSDNTTNTLSIKKEFETIKRNKAFWVKLERPFNPQKLNTINTQIITL